MKIALIQMNSQSDKAANIKFAAGMIERAAKVENADWVMMPEHFELFGGSAADKLNQAEDAPGGPAYSMAQEMAAKHKIWVHAGSFKERIPGEKYNYNTTCVFDRSGKEAARYRKMHLFDVTGPDGAKYHESQTVRPGRDVVTYDCEGITVGVAICYDIRFPELFQALAARGAQLIALPAAFTLQTGKDHWEVLARARAIETECYFAACGQTGAYMADGEKRFCYGHSLVADPWGHVVCKASDGPGLVTTRIDTALIARVRAQIPVAQHKVLGIDARKLVKAA